VRDALRGKREKKFDLPYKKNSDLGVIKLVFEREVQWDNLSFKLNKKTKQNKLKLRRCVLIWSWVFILVECFMVEDEIWYIYIYENKLKDRVESKYNLMITGNVREMLQGTTSHQHKWTLHLFLKKGQAWWLCLPSLCTNVLSSTSTTGLGSFYPLSFFKKI
jgi:hypothetical protein